MSTFYVLKGKFRVDRAPSWFDCRNGEKFSLVALICWWAWKYGTIPGQSFLMDHYSCVSGESWISKLRTSFISCKFCFDMEQLTPVSSY